MPRLQFSIRRLALVLTAGLLLWNLAPLAQAQFYTFTSGPSGDGFVWDEDQPPSGLNDLSDGETFFAPDDNGGFVNIENFSGNPNFFDDAYQAAGNSSVISGEAWWGNPIDNGFSTVGAYFINAANGFPTQVDFDFAWAMAGSDADDFIELQVYDEEFDTAFLSFELDNSFNAGGAFGGFDGWEGSVSFTLDDAQNENFDVDEIAGFSVFLDSIATLGGSGEFAIDNLSIDGSGGITFDGPEELYPSFSNPNNVSTGASTRWLRNTPVTQNSRFQFTAVNNSGSVTTFSASLDGTSDPQWNAEPPISGQVLPSGETASVLLAELPLSTLSGEYQASGILTNDLDPSDPDDTVTYTVKIYDAPQLTSNMSTPVPVHSGGQLMLANVAAGPHAGALRAGVEITSRTITGPFQFSSTGLLPGSFLAAGASDAEPLVFNRFGRLSRSYNGTATVNLEMNSEAGSFLNGSQPVPAVTWDLTYELTDQLADSASVNSGSSFAKQVGVNNASTAATLVGGTASATQTVTMQLLASPGGALLVTDVVEVTLGNAGELFALQLTYDENNLPSSLAEGDLQLLAYDSNTSTWDLAVDQNSDGGAGASSFAGSYDQFVSSVGQGNEVLSVFGTDNALDHLWAILDADGIFAVGRLAATLSADTEPDGDVDGADFLALQRMNASLIPTWQTEYGSSTGGIAAQAVPEPRAAILLTVGFLAVWGRWRKACIPLN